MILKKNTQKIPGTLQKTLGGRDPPVGNHCVRRIRGFVADSSRCEDATIR